MPPATPTRPQQTSTLLPSHTRPGEDHTGSIDATVVLVVRMRDVLGASDDLKGFGQSARIERRIVAGVGAGGPRAQAFVHDPLRGSPVQDTLAPGIIGPIEAVPQGLQVAVAGDRDAQHLPLHTPI